MDKVIDFEVRVQCVDPRYSYAVSAPAGSGKTGLITQRILSLLGVCQKPEEILAITFTKKAAAEMLHRVTGALAFGSKPLIDSSTDYEKEMWNLAQKVIARDKELGWGLLENISRLKINTIDGLSRSISSMMPLQSGLGGVPVNLETPFVAYRKAARNLFRHIDSENTLMSGAMEVFLEHLDNDMQKAESLLCNLLGSRDQWLPLILGERRESFVETLNKGFEESVNNKLNGLKERLSPVESSICLIADYAGSNLREEGIESNIAKCCGIIELPEAVSDKHDVWLGLIELFITGDGNWRKTSDKRIGMIAGDTKESKESAKQKKADWCSIIELMKSLDESLLDDLVGARKLPFQPLSGRDEDFINALSVILPIAAAELELVFRSLGGTDFTAITLGALNALSSEDSYTDLLLQYDNRVKHILVDEFQDTSKIQLAIVEKLTSGWTRGDGNTLFLVGDGMQSIYSFRNANVSIFLSVRNGYFKNIDVIPVDLEVNFRSTEGVVAWNNATFKQAFPKKMNLSRGGVPFSECVANKSDSFKGEVNCFLLKKEPSRKTESLAVVKQIKSLKEKYKNEKIAILVRSRGHLNSLFEVMKEEGMSWCANEIESLSQKQCILDVMSLTKSILCPNDRIAWLSILRAPWIGLSLDSLYAITNELVEGSQVMGDGYPIIIDQLMKFELINGVSQEDKSRLRLSVPLIEASWKSRRRKTLRDSVEGLWLSLGGPAMLKNDSDLLDIDTFFNLLSKCESAGQIPNIEEFSASLENLYAAPVTGGDPNLLVMSLHASKGLEFDHVIMLGLDRSNSKDDKELMLWGEEYHKDGSARLLLAAIGETGKDDSKAYSYLRTEKKARLKLENARLLYVGCTRAIKSLSLFGMADFDDEKGIYKEPSENSMLSTIWKTYEGESTKLIFDQTFFEVIQKKLRGGGLKRLDSARTKICFPNNNLLNAFRGSNLSHDDNNMPDKSKFWQRKDRAIGRVIHRILNQLSKVHVEEWFNIGWNDEKYIFNLLKSEGVVGGISDFEKIRSAIQKTLGSDVGRWIVDSSKHKLAESEAEYLVQRNGEILKRVIDRTFIDANEIRWIIDYKSSCPSVGQNEDEFFGQEKANYMNQLLNYREIFSKEGKRIKLGLFFPVMGKLLDIN